MSQKHELSPDPEPEPGPVAKKANISDGDITLGVFADTKNVFVIDLASDVSGDSGDDSDGDSDNSDVELKLRDHRSIVEDACEMMFDAAENLQSFRCHHTGPVTDQYKREAMETIREGLKLLAKNANHFIQRTDEYLK